MKCKPIDRLAFTRARCPNLQRQDTSQSVGQQIIAGLQEAIAAERANRQYREGVSTYPKTPEKYPKAQQHRQGYSICPNCGQETLIHEDGCMKCMSCAWSACG